MSLVEDVEICVLHTEQEHYTEANKTYLVYSEHSNLGGGVGSGDLKKIRINICVVGSLFGLPALKAHYHTLHVRRSPAAPTRLSPEQRVHSTRFNERCPFDILEMAYWGGEG